MSASEYVRPKMTLDEFASYLAEYQDREVCVFTWLCEALRETVSSMRDPELLELMADMLRARHPASKRIDDDDNKIQETINDTTKETP